MKKNTGRRQKAANLVSIFRSNTKELNELKKRYKWKPPQPRFVTSEEELQEIIKNAAENKTINLDLRNKGITELPSQMSSLGVNLKILNLSDNRLSSLQPDICQLTNLSKLFLRHNRLTTLPAEICQLTNLIGLYLSDNQITSLPPEICKLSNLKYLDVSNNPLTSPPPEIAEKGIEAIKEYFTALEQEVRPLNEVKVLLVGDGYAGKTSLVKQLLGEAFDKHEYTTHGINIRGWQAKNGKQTFRVNFWDFGGQEIMHATHQFFLSKRSLYVLVLDGRKDDKTEYWLRHIESFGGDSPVLIVLNKQDTNPGFDLNRPFLLEKYPFIRSFHHTSCKTQEGIKQFRSALLNELGQVKMIETHWPSSWFQVKERLEQMDKPYISRDEYDTCCLESGIAKRSREVLVDFLHDLGVAVHFNDFVLQHTHVLNPKWVTNGVYTIINSKELAENKGILYLKDLREILKRPESSFAERLKGLFCSQAKEKHTYPSETHVYIVELMKKFELCYELDRERVLIPQLLGVVEPNFSFGDQGSLRFILYYPDFLPLSILPRFMVKRHKHIKDSLRWRTGMVLEDKEHGSQAVVKADYEKQRIHIRVNGPHRKEYLHFLWYSFREINASFEKLRVSERIPMPDDPAVTADYQTLLKYAERGHEMYIPEGSDKEYSVRELLGLIEPSREDEQTELLRMIKAQLDEKDSEAEVLNSLFKLEPSILGVGINLNEAFKRILATQKGRKK